MKNTKSGVDYCNIGLVFPPRPQDSDDICESLRLKLLHRGIQDHAYLTLLQSLTDKALPPHKIWGTIVLRSVVDAVIWRLPIGGAARDHPHVRDAGYVERVRRMVADTIEYLVDKGYKPTP